MLKEKLDDEEIEFLVGQAYQVRALKDLMHARRLLKNLHAAYRFAMHNVGSVPANLHQPMREAAEMLEIPLWNRLSVPSDEPEMPPIEEAERVNISVSPEFLKLLKTPNPNTV